MESTDFISYNKFTHSIETYNFLGYNVLLINSAKGNNDLQVLLRAPIQAVNKRMTPLPDLPLLLHFSCNFSKFLVASR